jgi:hypothetical protein
MNARISYRTFVLVGLVSLATVSTAFAGGKGPFTYPGKVNGGMRSTIGCYPSGKSGSNWCGSKPNWWCGTGSGCYRPQTNWCYPKSRSSCCDYQPSYCNYRPRYCTPSYCEPNYCCETPCYYSTSYCETYEPCYTPVTTCDYVPQYNTTCDYVPEYRTECEYVPQYYTTCEYVPQYRTECEYVPQYYTTCDYVPQYNTECEYVPQYKTTYECSYKKQICEQPCFYKPNCCDYTPSCNYGSYGRLSSYCRPSFNNCSVPYGGRSHR